MPGSKPEQETLKHKYMYIIKMLNLETTTVWKIITLSHLFKRNEEKKNLKILFSSVYAEFKMPRRTSFDFRFVLIQLLFTVERFSCDLGTAGD